MRVHADGGAYRDLAVREGRERLVAGLPEAAVGDTAAVLDAVDTDGDRLLHRGSAVRVRGDRQTGRVGSIHNEAQLGGRELGAHDIAARSVDASRGHHLDDVHAALHPFGDGSDDLRGPGDFPAHEVTVPGRAGQGRSGRDDGRLAGAGGRLLVSTLDNAEAPIAQITHGGHARGKLVAKRPGDDLVDLLVGVAGDPIQGRDSAVGDQVRVRFDQAGQQCSVIAGHRTVIREREIVRIRRRRSGRLRSGWWRRGCEMIRRRRRASTGSRARRPSY